MKNDIIVTHMQIGLNKSMYEKGSISNEMYKKADKILQDKLTLLLQSDMIDHSERKFSINL